MTIAELKALRVGTRVWSHSDNFVGTIVPIPPEFNATDGQTEIRWDDGTTMSLRILRDSMTFRIAVCKNK
jgi:hypothetical protein